MPQPLAKKYKTETFTLMPIERKVYNHIFQETAMKNRRCASLSLEDISKATGIGRSTVNFELKRLKKRQLIKIDKTEKTNIICLNVEYKEIY